MLGLSGDRLWPIGRSSCALVLALGATANLYCLKRQTTRRNHRIPADSAPDSILQRAEPTSGRDACTGRRGNRPDPRPAHGSRTRQWRACWSTSMTRSNRSASTQRAKRRTCTRLSSSSRATSRNSLLGSSRHMSPSSAPASTKRASVLTISAPFLAFGDDQRETIEVALSRFDVDIEA